MKILIITLLFSFQAKASLVDFNAGLKKAFYFGSVHRADELSSKIRVTKFGALGRILSPDATATYNDKTNTISINPELIVKNKVKSAQTILTPNYSGFSQVATIFHEMAHGEIDIFIENKKELTDLTLKYFYESKLRPLYRKYFKGINPWIVFHEHFAYYRTELIETMALDIMDVMMENGWVPNTGRCYLTPKLKNELANGASLSEFLEIKTQKERNYRNVSPGYIFVKGKDLNLDSIKGEDAKILKEAHLLFWSYHQEFFKIVLSAKDLASKMNLDPQFISLKKCRENLYYQ